VRETAMQTDGLINRSLSRLALDLEEPIRDGVCQALDAIAEYRATCPFKHVPDTPLFRGL